MRLVPCRKTPTLADVSAAVLFPQPHWQRAPQATMERASVLAGHLVPGHPSESRDRLVQQQALATVDVAGESDEEEKDEEKERYTITLCSPFGLFFFEFFFGLVFVSSHLSHLSFGFSSYAARFPPVDRRQSTVYMSLFLSISKLKRFEFLFFQLLICFLNVVKRESWT